jgi:hypothetical protein
VGEHLVESREGGFLRPAMEYWDWREMLAEEQYMEVSLDIPNSSARFLSLQDRNENDA